MRTKLLPLLMLFAALAAYRMPAASTTRAEATKLANSHLNDSQIENLIRAKLAKGKMASEGFTVHVHNKVATIEGKTSVIQRKGAVTRLAKASGAASVVNNIKISEEARQKALAKLAKNRNGGQPIERATLVK